MKKNRKITAFIVSLLILLTIGFLIYQQVYRTNNLNKKNQVSVRMKWFFAGTMTGWFAGVDQGFFNDVGINLKINSGGPDNSSIKLVASGSDMFGVAGADEVLIAIEKGIPIVPIAVLFKESPVGFISKKEKNILTPSDWNNKTIEVDFGGNTEIQYRALLKKFDVQNINEVPYAYSLVPFIEGKVDVSVAYLMDQVITLQNRGIDLNVITAKEYGINPYGDVVITSQKTFNENFDLVKAFTKAFIKSHQWAVQNKEKSVEILVNNVTNLSYKNEFDVWNTTIPFIISDDGFDKIGIMDLDRWKETQNILLEFGALSTKQTIDFTNP